MTEQIKKYRRKENNKIPSNSDNINYKSYLDSARNAFELRESIIYVKNNHEVYSNESLINLNYSVGSEQFNKEWEEVLK